MNVTCPQCSTKYLLPGTLLGREGARVRCPRCNQRFLVSPEGEIGVDTSPPSPPVSAPSEQVREVAREVLTGLESRLGDGLAEAMREGALFQRHGVDVLSAYDEYRQRVGSRAGSEAFRAELKQRWGLDLFPAVEQDAR